MCPQATNVLLVQRRAVRPSYGILWILSDRRCGNCLRSDFDEKLRAVSTSEGFLSSYFVKEIYQPSITRSNIRDVVGTAISLGRGTNVIDSYQNCDRYTALYGGIHFHKLYAAFSATNFPYLHAKRIEIIDWGCGQALATCTLIEYLASIEVIPEISTITLVEPSNVAMERGCSLVHQVLQANSYGCDRIHLICKRIDSLQIDELVSARESIKVHLLSNILDIETFQLEGLYTLISGAFSGINRFICVSPYNRNGRLDQFHTMFSNTRHVVCCDEALHEEIFFFRTGTYKRQRINRCERQFTANLD